MTRRAQKLRARLSTSGESVVETLAAVLICSLAILMLYTAIASASRMNAAVDAASAAGAEAVLQAEAQTPTGDFREVTVDGFDESYTVEYFAQEGSAAVSYRYTEDTRWPV